MRELKTGEKADLAQVHCKLHIGARDEAFLHNRTGLAVVPLDDQGRLTGDFTLLLSRNRELRPGASFTGATDLSLDLDAVPASVARLLLVIYTLGGAESGASLADLGEVGFQLDTTMVYHVDMTGRREGALILAEIYRRNAAWRISPNGQGFMGGVPMMARALNIDLAIPDSIMARRERDPHGDPHGDPRSDRDRPPAGATSSGSGFAVTPRMVVTNYHVIEDFADIKVSSDAAHGTATVVASDPVNDIALLSIDHNAAATVRFRGEGDIDLGEDIIVAGFPLQGLLGSGPQISAGNVSALTGMRNDSSQLQFNAPIGSGSSGGPILDSSGLVVGLVRAVLRTDLSHAPIAQNINFGVKGALVRSFLHASGVTPVLAPATAARNRADIAREARSFLYKINITH